VRVIVSDSPMRERCCDSHSRTCEPPAELCCEACPEVEHPEHRTSYWCVLETPPELVDEIAEMLAAIQINYEREGAGPGSRFEGQRLEFAQARSVIRRIFRYVRVERGEVSP
jgi:hypothetical protein